MGCCKLKGWLLTRSVISAPCTDLQVFLQSGDFDGTIPSVSVEIGWLVGNRVLAAQFIFNRRKRARDVLHLERKECPPARSRRKIFQYFVAPQNQATVVGGNRVNQHFRALRHLDGLGACYLTLIVFAIAYHNNRFPYRMIEALGKLVLARFIDRIIQRGPAAAAEFLNSR